MKVLICRFLLYFRLGEGAMHYPTDSYVVIEFLEIEDESAFIPLPVFIHR